MIAKRAGPRAPAIAGSFHPRPAQTLSRTVRDLLSGAVVQPRAQRCGVIAPHAGYAYSGAVAAQAFASVQSLRGRIRRTVIVGPAHFVPFVGIAAPSATAFMTP